MNTGSPVYFGIVMSHGVERPQLFYDEVPRALLVKRSPLVYCCRLDKICANVQIALTVRDIYAVYRGWKADGKLPPDERGERPKAEAPADG
ncbi:MAG TPA: hypothetical protein VJ890_21200 [Vineibacter sp.]|nr:hypothetical protein [Vineibacter sp.]